MPVLSQIGSAYAQVEDGAAAIVLPTFTSYSGLLESTSTEDPPVVETPDEAPAEEPPAEEPPVEEPVEEPPVEEAVEEPPAEEAVEEPATEVVGESLADIVEVLNEEEVVLMDAGGEEIPLASVEAAEALHTSDPYFETSTPGVYDGYTTLGGTCAQIVYDSGGNCHNTITPVQDAVNAAPDGTDIFIEGTFYEQVVISGKALNLIGAAADAGLSANGVTLAQVGSGSGFDFYGLLTITNATVNIQGLTIDGTGGTAGGSGDLYAGILFNDASGGVFSSTITDFDNLSGANLGVGVCIYNSSNVTVEDNEIARNDIGIAVEGIDVFNMAEGIKIEHNDIYLNGTGLDMKNVWSDWGNNPSYVMYNNINSNVNGVLVDNVPGWPLAYPNWGVRINYNNIYDNTNLDFIDNNENYLYTDARYNYWGTTDPDEIDANTSGLHIYQERCNNYTLVCTRTATSRWGFTYCADWSLQCSGTYNDYTLSEVYPWESLPVSTAGAKPEENVCPAGQFYNLGVCESCLPGTYKSPGQNFCTACPEGSVSGPGASGCTTCPAGTYDVGNVCQSCPDGSVSGPGASGCTPCEAGKYDVDNVCQSCLAGTYSGTGAAVCTDCAAGSSTNGAEGSSSCTKCAAGTYSDTTGAAECTKCETGTYSDTTGADACTACETGTYSDTTGADACTACETGTYADATGSIVCTDCSAGTYADVTGSETCTPCAEGTYEAGTGSTACTGCSPGTYADVTGLTACTDCSAGTYADATGSIVCTDCSAGTYADVTGSIVCTDCSAGTYEAGTGSTACTDCSAGTYEAGTGSIACTDCSPGSSTYGAEGSSSCTLCAPNTYADLSGMAVCLNCPPDYKCGQGAVACVYDGDLGGPIGPIGLVGPLGLIIPVTGGELVELSCDFANTLELSDGNSIIFDTVLCGYLAGLASELEETLPVDLPDGSDFIASMTLTLILDGDPVEGETFTVSFAIPEGMEGGDFAILAWDADTGSWVEVGDVTVADGFVTVTMDSPGTFVLVE